MVFGIPFQVRDTQKSMRDATRRLAAALPADTSRVAAYRLDETGRAIFEFYAGVVLTPLDTPRDVNNYHIRELAAPAIAEILAGTHPDYSSILARENRPEGRVWSLGAEVATEVLDEETYYYLAAPTPPTPAAD